MSGATLLQVGEPLSAEAFDFICGLMEELENVRSVVGGEGHQNLGDRVEAAIKQAAGRVH